MLELTSKQNEFLAWFKQPKTLNKLRYASGDSNCDEINSAYEEAIADYKRFILYFAGIKLWSNHRNAFKEHKKYYCNHLRKSHNMSIVNFNNQMKKYRELLRYLPPPSQKKCKKSVDAN